MLTDVQISKLVASSREALKSGNMATVSSGSAFLNLVEVFRHTSKDSILKELNDYDNADIV